MGTVKPEKTHYSRNMSMVWGADPADGLWASLAVDSDGYLYAKTYVKDPDTLLWVPAVQGLKASDTLEVTGPVTDDELRATDVKTTLDNERVNLSDDISEALEGICIELKVISYLLNEGLNTKEDLDALREEYESELGG